LAQARRVASLAALVQREANTLVYIEGNPTQGSDAAYLPNQTFWCVHFADVRGLANVRFAPIVLQKSFRDDERHFSGPLMRSAHGDVARFSASIDFRLLQQYPPFAVIRTSDLMEG
jgi:hypothetical protein